MTLPTDRTTANTAAEHVADHNDVHGQLNALSPGTYAPLTGATRFFPASIFEVTIGAPSMGITGGGARFRGWLLDAASNEQVNLTYEEPVGWLTYAYDIYWSNSGAGAGDVYWRPSYSKRGAGDDLNLGDVTDTIGAVAAPLLDILKVTAGATITVDATKPLKHLRVLRVANDAADTLANDCIFFGLMLRRLT